MGPKWWLRSGAQSPLEAPAPPATAPVTQLALLLALGLIGLVLSFAFGRFEVKRSPVSATVKRAEGALERASLLLLRLVAVRGLTLLAVPGLGLCGFALFAKLEGPLSNVGRAAFLVLSLLAGAGSTLLQARFALGLGARAASSATAALARGSSLTMRPLLRASVAIAVFGDALGVLGVAAAFACVYAIRGGFAAPEPSVALGTELATLLPAFALGAAVAALALTREGSVAASAAGVGGTPSAELGETAEGGDARDPALLARLMGHLVGELVPRTVASYICGLAVTVATARLAAMGALAGTGTLSCLVLVGLVRSFGALGSICGVLAARVADEEPPPWALGRGIASAFLVSVFGLAAALFWLERAHFVELLGAGTLGLASMLLVGQAAWLPLRRRGSARELAEARSSGDAALIVRSASTGLLGWWPSLVVPALALALAEHAFNATAPSGLVAIAFVSGALALGPFALSLSGFGLLTGHARGLAALSRLELEAPRRVAKLDEASAWGGIAGATHGSLTLALSALLGLVSLGPSMATPSLLGLSALALGLGAAAVLVFGARATQSAILGARLVALEVERQRRDLPQKHGVISAPSDFTPSYKACVDAAFSAARGASLLEVLALLLAPFLLGLLLLWSGAGGGTPALVSFGMAAVLASLILTLASRATRAQLSEVRRRAKSNDAGAATSPALQAQSFGELVGVTTASSVEAFALVLALTVLCLAPLLH